MSRAIIRDITMNESRDERTNFLLKSKGVYHVSSSIKGVLLYVLFMTPVDNLNAKPDYVAAYKLHYWTLRIVLNQRERMLRNKYRITMLRNLESLCYRSVEKSIYLINI